MALPLTPEMSKKMGPYVNREVIMGIRPEKIYDKLFAKTATDSNTMTASVEVVEQMGSEIYVYLKNEDSVFIARVDAHEQLESGQDIDLVFDMSKCHFFDPQSQRNLVY